MWSNWCGVHEYEVLQMSLYFVYNPKKADWSHRLRKAGNVGKVALRIPFFLDVPLFKVWPTHRCPGRDLNTGFAEPGWQQGTMAFTRSASLLGPWHTTVHTPALQELWSRCTGPGFKDAALFLGISVVWERTTSYDTPGMLLCPLPALLLSESGYSCCVLWLALIVRLVTRSSTCGWDS